MSSPLKSPPRRRGADKLMAVTNPALDFELLFRSAPSLLLVLEPTPDFRILGASDAYLRAMRAGRDAIIGKKLFEAFPETLEGSRTTGAGSLHAALERVLASRTADALNSPVVTPDGRLRYIIHRVDSIELELLRSARERDEAMRQLKSANEELEAFVYSASHDLQAPLRAIDGFCKVFEQLNGSVLDDGVRRLITRITSNVGRMDAIIEALLSLSRIGRTPMTRSRVNLGAIAQRVVGELRERDPLRKVSVDIAEGLEAWADPGLAAIVLDNLIGNAWKYTAQRDEAHIHIGKRGAVGQSVFYVRDNGAGFDMEQAGKLFQPFSRLHSDPDFAGNGIGLATVKRAVERHGGEVWAEAQVDLGASFHFTFGGPDAALVSPGPAGSA
jgi:signal transduction histidine kinase